MSQGGYGGGTSMQWNNNPNNGMQYQQPQVGLKTAPASTPNYGADQGLLPPAPQSAQPQLGGIGGGGASMPVPFDQNKGMPYPGSNGVSMPWENDPNKGMPYPGPNGVSMPWENDPNKGMPYPGPNGVSMPVDPSAFPSFKASFDPATMAKPSRPTPNFVWNGQQGAKPNWQGMGFDPNTQAGMGAMRHFRYWAQNPMGNQANQQSMQQALAQEYANLPANAFLRR